VLLSELLLVLLVAAALEQVLVMHLMAVEAMEILEELPLLLEL
jgi:hypothetical protein